MGAEKLRPGNAGTNFTETGVLGGRAGAMQVGFAGRVSRPNGEGMGIDPPDPPWPAPPLPLLLLLVVALSPPQAAMMEARIPRGRRRERE
jgi:hypothetical protein